MMVYQLERITLMDAPLPPEHMSIHMFWLFTTGINICQDKCSSSAWNSGIAGNPVLEFTPQGMVLAVRYTRQGSNVEDPPLEGVEK
jgi:hypothetical protein